MTKTQLIVLTYVSLGTMTVSLALILTSAFTWPYIFPWGAFFSSLLGFAGVCISYVLNQLRIRKLTAPNAAAELSARNTTNA